jgi:Tfp pilus assembly protein PilV
VRANLRTEDGFGLIELLIAIVMLNVGILALVASFNSSTLAIQRASQTATAATLAGRR